MYKIARLAIAPLLLLPISALAQTDIGTVANDINQSLNEVGPFLGGLSYIMGAVFGLKTGLALKDHSESPQQTPLKRPATLFVMSSCFFSLPSLMDTGFGTLFKNQTRDKVIDHGGNSHADP